MGCGTSFNFKLLQKFAHGKILDLGCGKGQAISKFRNCQKFGIDISKNSIQIAKQEYTKINFQVSSVYKLPFKDNFFDFVYSLDVIEHLEHPEKMLIETKRILKPNGIFIIQTPNYPIKRFYDFLNFFAPRGFRKTFADDPTHIFKFSARSLKKIVEKHFKILEIRPRNILFESKLPFIKNLKKPNNFLGNLLGQKTILICQKS